MGFLLFCLGIRWASVVSCLASVLSISLSIIHPPFSFSSPFTTLSVKPPYFILPASLPTFLFPFHCFSVQRLSLLFALAIFSAVLNLLLELFIEILVSIIFLYLNVPFGSPSNRIGDSLYFLVLCIVISSFLYFLKYDNHSFYFVSDKYNIIFMGLFLLPGIFSLRILTHGALFPCVTNVFCCCCSVDWVLSVCMFFTARCLLFLENYL